MRVLRRSGAAAGPSERRVAAEVVRRLRALSDTDPLARVVFDAGWYAARYEDVRASAWDPLEHFLRHGAAEGRAPSAFLDPRVVRAGTRGLSPSPAAPLLHVLRRGLEGPTTTALFDPAWYARVNPDVAAGRAAPLEHFVLTGCAEGRDPNPWFATAAYVAAHPDVARSGLDPFVHFVTVGRGLGWWPHPAWDEDAYVDANPYAREVLALRACGSGYEHFCWMGADQVRRGAVLLPVRIDGRTEEFAEAAYVAANPDVAARIAAGSIGSGVEHLFREGLGEVARGTRPLLRAEGRSGNVEARGDAARPAARWLALYAHFDPDGVVDAHVVRAVRALADGGIDVCLVTAGADADSVGRLGDAVRWVVRRDANDAARDFGAWSLAAELLGDDVLDAYERVLLINDSIAFPVVDPAPMLEALAASTADLWGVTDAHIGGRYHLQSYFLAVRREARRDLLGMLADRLRRVPVASKLGLIASFEVGLTQHALALGRSVEAWVPTASLQPLGARFRPARAELHPVVITAVNPTHHCWRALVEEWRVPVLKFELLRDNPVRSDLDGWEQVVDPRHGDAAEIAAYVARYRRAAAGSAAGDGAHR